MSTVGVSKFLNFLFYRNGKVAKQNGELIVEKNLYTILGFKSRENFEKKINKSINKKVWLSLIDRFKKEINHPELKTVVINVLTNIVKKCNSDNFAKISPGILHQNQDSKKKREAIKKVLDILKKTDPNKAFDELTIVKKEAESLLKSDFYKSPIKSRQGPGPSSAQLFAKL